MTNWIGRELRKTDMAVLASLVGKAPRPQSIFLKAAVSRGADYPGWWYGAWRDGQTLEAVMAIDNYQGMVYADNEDAARGFAGELYASQKRLGPTIQTHRHQYIGEAKTMSIVWPMMRDLPGRKLVFDKECDLFQSAPGDGSDAPSGRVLFDLAQRSDERILYDFFAEQKIEQMGVDPRKIARDTYAQRITDLVAYGRALIAKEKDTGRPFFVAELADLGGDTMLLNDTWVPPHYRARGKLLTQAFWAAARHPAVGPRELLYLSADSTLGGATRAAGWKRIAGYRWSVTHG